MKLLILLFIIIILIVLLRLYNVERFNTLQEIIENKKIERKDLLKNAKEILNYSDNPISIGNIEHDNKLINDFINDELLTKDENKKMLVDKNNNEEKIKNKENFNIKIQKQNHDIFTKNIKNFMTLRNIKYELMKIANEIKPLSIIKNEYKNYN